jgi:hypothetical protein
MDRGPVATGTSILPEKTEPSEGNSEPLDSLARRPKSPDHRPWAPPGPGDVGGRLYLGLAPQATRRHPSGVLSSRS